MCAWGAQAGVVFLGSHVLPYMAEAEILIYMKGLCEIRLM